MKGLPKFLTVNSVSDTCLAIGVFVVSGIERMYVFLAHRCINGTDLGHSVMQPSQNAPCVEILGI